MDESKSIWSIIMDINKKALDKGVNYWKYLHEEDFVNDLVGELGELANNIKHYHYRGSRKHYSLEERIKLIHDIKIELFDMYVYFVLGWESFYGNENDFSNLADEKLYELKKRFGVE